MKTAIPSTAAALLATLIGSTRALAHPGVHDDDAGTLLHLLRHADHSLGVWCAAGLLIITIAFFRRRKEPGHQLDHHRAHQARRRVRQP